MLISTPRLRTLLLCILLLAGLPGPRVRAQDDPWARGSVGTALLLRKLDGVKRVLVIGAHPDDEDTALLTALARGMGVETAYLSLSRGEGGQNLIGPELDEGLGILRTGELLAARALDGGRQYFTRAFDFGFSKSAEETFRYWPEEELLRDVTWVVRTFQPQIIVSVFSGSSRDGHGQHQAAGIVAHEVFRTAGDPSRYPEQLALGVSPWTPTKLYRRTRGDPGEVTISVETGAFDPLLGRSHFQIAMDSRSQHRSQDMGMPQPPGPRRSTLALVESRGGGGGPDDLFAGVDTTLLSLTAELPATLRGGVEEDLQAYRRAVGEAWELLEVTRPWQATPALGRALEALSRALDRLIAGEGREAEGGSVGSARLRRFLDERIPLVQEALLRAAGVVVDVKVEDDLLVPGEEVGVQIEVWNGGPFVMSEISGRIEGPEGWVVEDAGAPRVGAGTSPGAGASTEAGAVPPGAVAQWGFSVRVPRGAELSKLYYLEEAMDGELYRWPAADAALWGEAGNPELLTGLVSMRVESLARVELRRTGRFRSVDKATGEFVEPVHVVPALSVSLDPPIMAWPLGASGGRELTVTVRSQSTEPQSGAVTLQLPEGWHGDPESRPFTLSVSGEEASFPFLVSPPGNLAEGSYRIQARARTDGGDEYREEVTLVDYPHVLRSALFTDAATRVSVFPVAVPQGLRVGYVMGSGDTGPEAIRQMGLEVDLLQPDAVRAGAFDPYDVVVLGIRAYETRPDLAAANERLLDYARSGRTVIVQYNKYEFPQGGFAPYPVAIARPHDRVADETVPVRILDPQHPVFNTPNRIGPGDFDGWAQERGLYFLSRWDDGFVPLLEMADPGEGPKRGGLVVAPVGEGIYVYTGLAFFRQFPEGVPGAYRLFANLLALKGSGAPAGSAP